MFKNARKKGKAILSNPYRKETFIVYNGVVFVTDNIKEFYIFSKIEVFKKSEYYKKEIKGS
jgi:hypothetical protein